MAIFDRLLLHIRLDIAYRETHVDRIECTSRYAKKRGKIPNNPIPSTYTLYIVCNGLRDKNLYLGLQVAATAP